ncbi:MAG: OmpA family protein [Deltaproteobacteria bacterium]|jgi:outer membrane protein OmpA-like peptidoglycan-associated protein/Mg-chelatase subunit ChlD|nr:OmpA family protein [Deltaproteobacteria bacterium]
MKHYWTGLMLLGFWVFASSLNAAEDQALQVSVGKPGAAVNVERIVEDGKLVVSVDDAEAKQLFGLGLVDFIIEKAGRKAKVTAVQPFDESFDVPLNIVLVLDNSYSMKERNAIEPLKAAVDELFKLFRPIDRVSLVVFDKRNTISVNGQPLHVSVLKTSRSDEMRGFLEQAYNEKNITYETWLFEAMLAGYDQLRQMPKDEQKFMVVFSDGEDLGSAVKYEDVQEAAGDLPDFGSFTIDFMPTQDYDPVLQAYSSSHQGMIWKAKEETNLVPIFQEVATRLQRFYLVSYLFPPEGTLGVQPKSLIIEEIQTIDASPMLGHIYFSENSSEISGKYVHFDNPEQAAIFEESDFEDTLDKYYQVLNIVGKRMKENAASSITLTGCNSNTGAEKGNKSLSEQRAVTVSNYLQRVWQVDPERIMINVRNLPPQPSTSRIEEGRADNRRVEIDSTSPEILDLIRSSYTDYRTDTSMLEVNPIVDSVYGIAFWRASVTGSADELIVERQGEGPPPEVMVLPLPGRNLKELGLGGDLVVNMELADIKGQSLTLLAPPVQVNFIQTSKLLAEQEGYLAQEKYALILFDFDSDKIGDRNQTIVAEIVARIRELPKATVSIVGHTDNIGKEDYNLKLSERRAKAVYDQIIDIYGTDPTGRISYRGVGATDPPYDNLTPEARAFNRTVTITLEYMVTE